MNPESSNFNPHAPSRVGRDLQAGSEVEKIRYELLGHEAGLKGVGGAYLIVGLCSALAGILALRFAWHDFAPSFWQRLQGLGPGGCLLLFALLLFWLAYHLRSLDEKSRRLFFVCGWIGLLFFPPVGTIVNGYLL